ncbi:unnamed protein product [Candidula unifasciata]|uniref:Ig-like domain-containing protein n=1 Tax=Candidula unifasciata TaxID=100452 RepID=A0A8S3YUS4_9EUPU|nr:unnamed protein product [Candidula unifasciata]
MDNWLNVSLFLACCCLQTLAETTEYPPVLEGSSITLKCSGNSSSKRSVYWKVARFSRPPSDVSICTFSAKTCQDNNTSKYQATVNATEREFFSSFLTIHNITSEDQNSVFECLIDNLPERIQTWNLSKVFYGPDDFSCTTVYAKISSEINITCSTSKVFPGLICEMGQLYNRNNITSVTPSTPVVYENFEKSERHISATCFAVIPIFESGIYQYYITGYAGVTTNDRYFQNKKFFKTNEVDVYPHVAIEHKTANRCAGSDTPELFWCTAMLMPSPVSFIWSVYNGSKPIEIQLLGKKSGNFHRSTFELQKPEWWGLITVTCMVNYTVNSQNRTLKQSISVKMLSIAWPYFTHNHNTITGRVESLNMNTGTSSFECRLKEDKSVHTRGSNDVSLNVTCYSKEEPHMMMMMSSINNGDSVTFTIDHNKTKPGFCQCFAYHKLDPGCYKSANITFLIPIEGASKGQEPGMTYLIYYIVAGTIGAILFIFTCGVCLFLKHKWHELYTYIYFSVSVRSERSLSERDYEPVRSPSSGFSFDRSEGTRECNGGLGYYNNSHGSFRGLFTAPMVHAGSKDTGLCKYNTGNSRLHVNPERDILQRKVPLLHLLEHKVGVAEETSVTARLLLNLPPICRPFQHTSSMTQCHLADYNNSHTSDEPSWFDHDHKTPPRPCMAYTRDSVWPINSLYESPRSSLHLNIPNDRYLQANTCTETSESEDSFYTTTVSPLAITDPETYFVPISNPSDNKRPQIVSQQSQLIKQQTQRPPTTTGLTVDSQSRRRPEYPTACTGPDFHAPGAVHLNDETASKLSPRGAWSIENSTLISEYINTSMACFKSESKVEPLSSIEDSPVDAEYINTSLICYRRKSKLEPSSTTDDSSLVFEYINTSSMSYNSESKLEPSSDVGSARCLSVVPSLLSHGTHTCEKIKQMKNIHAPLKSRSHSSLSNKHQTGNNRIRKNRNTKYNRPNGNKTCVYENIQTVVSECSRLESQSLDM